MATPAKAAGHELVHLKQPIHKFVGSLAFMITFQFHFWDEHVKNHHKNVGTF
jgi:hypothetical protein